MTPPSTMIAMAERRWFTSNGYNTKDSVYQSAWKGREQEKEKARNERSPKKGSEPFQGRKVTIVTPSPSAPRTSNIKCFKCLVKDHIAAQCPNKRDMIVRDDEEVESNLCSIIIDEGNCVNMASERLARKLALPTLWLSEHEELIVNRQVKVAFILGRYEDKVLYDVVPMKATHLLLGRSTV
ncbi:hypothetical protein CR513_01539, partial [Mucuna pruriens]